MGDSGMTAEEDRLVNPEYNAVFEDGKEERMASRKRRGREAWRVRA
jgi:hypothetical protein